MEWKIVCGQICLTVLGVTSIAMGYDGGIIYTLIGALSASIGIPAVLAATKQSKAA